MNSLSTGWNSLQMSVKCKDFMVVAREVGLNSSGDLWEHLRVDLSSVEWITAFKLQPTIWGDVREFQKSSGQFPIEGFQVLLGA